MIVGLVGALTVLIEEKAENVSELPFVVERPCRKLAELLM
jgi:hypothetical protein